MVSISSNPSYWSVCRENHEINQKLVYSYPKWGKYENVRISVSGIISEIKQTIFFENIPFIFFGFLTDAKYVMKIMRSFHGIINVIAVNCPLMRDIYQTPEYNSQQKVSH